MVIVDQSEKIVILKEAVVKQNLIVGIVCYIASIGAFFMFAYNFLNLGVLAFALVIIGVIVGSINVYIYRFKPAWFIRQYETKVQKQTGKQVVVE